MTDRALVPLDQPYGTRQATEQAIGQAAPRRAMPPDLLGAIKPTVKPDMATILAPPQEVQPLPLENRLRMLRDSTPNPVLRAVLTRTLGD